jgi:hypothetical protein
VIEKGMAKVCEDAGAAPICDEAGIYLKSITPFLSVEVITFSIT